ncbi:MAG: Fur family transcriptional regulator [Solirubrobacteraceae bacterium]
MTQSPDTPPLAFNDIAGAVRALRGRGLRLTTPRRLVLEALFAAKGPVSAEHLAHELNLDITSVYRNLETLEHHGLAQHVHLGHGPGLYVLVGHGEHAFLSCERCGAVRTLTTEELGPVRDRVQELFGYQARFTHFPIVGLCPACTAAPRESAPATTDAVAGATPATPTGESTATRASTEDQDGDHQHPGDPGPHEHEHNHGGYVHSHPHAHEGAAEPQHEHRHSPR